MMARNIATTGKRILKRIFHKRNVIIVSEHQVKHIHLSGLMQCALLGVLAVVILWASYSTGRFMAAKKQLPSVQVASEVEQEEESTLTSLFSFGTGSDKDALIERVALLEKQVTELEESKAHIIERVRTKTEGQIDNLERIILQTGLSPKDLRKKYSSKTAKGKQAVMGGPYVPDKLDSKNATEELLYMHLDELAMWRDIIGNLPISSPMKNSIIHSHFGRRIDPFNGRLAFHSGIDLAGPFGARVLSAADGKVIAAKRSRSYGNYIDVDHGYDITTRYAHLDKFLVSAGQKVKQGDVIGVQGNSGRSTGSHLHYEVRHRGQALNPQKFLTAGYYVLEN